MTTPKIAPTLPASIAMLVRPIRRLACGAMLGGVRARTIEHWRVVAFLIVAVVAFVTVLLMASIVVAAPVAVTAFSAVLLRARPAKPPRPTLALRVLRQSPLWLATEATRSMGELSGKTSFSAAHEPSADPVGGAIVGRRRTLDVESLVEDAIRSARAQAPRGGLSTAMGIGSPWAPPTAADHERFEAEVDAYAERVREWLTEVDAFLANDARLLIAEVVQTNPTGVDAREARVLVSFPLAFEPVDRLPEVPERPDVPGFPLRRSAMSLAMSGYGLARPGWDQPLFTSGVSTIEAVSMWEPHYHVDGQLRIDYPRQTIRHGEREAAGDPFTLRCPDPGEYEIGWEIHAANLERSIRGTWTLSTRTETAGDPVQTLADLYHMLSQLSADDDSADA